MLIFFSEFKKRDVFFFSEFKKRESFSTEDHKLRDFSGPGKKHDDVQEMTTFWAFFISHLETNYRDYQSDIADARFG